MHTTPKAQYNVNDAIDLTTDGSDPGEILVTRQTGTPSVVSIKDETFTLETSRDRTKMRFLRSAIKSVDVRVSDIRAAASEKTEEDKKENTKEQKKIDKKANKAEKEAAQNDENAVTTDSPAEDKKD